MHNDNNQALVKSDSFFSRVIQNDSFKRGVGTAAAGILVAAVVELIWPSTPNS